MATLKLTKIGNSTGIILPKDVLSRMHLAAGDDVYYTETPEGIRLTPYDPEFEQQMQVARDVMKRRRNALRELAK